MKTPVYTFVGLFAVVLLLTACGGSKTEPLSDRIRKVWTANIVKEGSTTVYTKGGASNTKPGYSNFRLDLSSTAAKTAKLRELDGNEFVGNWDLSADEKTLTLTGLTPQPTGTSGTIAYTITGDVTATQLNLVRTSTSAKTGGTLNDYQLTNP